LVNGLLFLGLVICLAVFIFYLVELSKREPAAAVESSVVKPEWFVYLENKLGLGEFKLFKTMMDAEGDLVHIVYLPHYEWFKAPEYRWFEVYDTNAGFKHNEME
jgi:hypothetical protein